MTLFQEFIKPFISRVFGIREGEVIRALLMNWNIFLIISTLLVVKPTSNGLFLAKFGVEQLPYAFILVAVVAAVISTGYARMVMNISLQKIFRYTLVMSIGLLFALGFLLKFNMIENLVLYLFYVWVAIYGLLTTSQIWITANLLFDPREAKRVFSFIGAGAIAGGIFGGYLTSVASNLIGGEDLLFMAGMMLIPCLMINRYLWNNYLLPDNPVPAAASQVKYDTRRPIQILKESRHLRLIAALVGVSVMVAKLVDYQFGGMASELIPDPDELTAFFGFWMSTFSVISLFLQLFVTKRVVGTYGVGTSLFFLPLAILAAIVLILIFPETMFAIVFLKMSDGGLKQSVNKAAMELIIFPVPQALKNKTKTFIDVFVDSLATGIIGLLLIFVIKGMDLSYQAVSMMTLVFIFLWIYLADLVRKEYVRTITIKLKSLGPTDKDVGIDLSKASVYQGIQKAIREGHPKQQIFLLRKLRDHRDDRLIPFYLTLLDAPDAEVRSATLQNLYPYSKLTYADKIIALTKDPSREVRLRAIEYVIRHIPEEEKIINRYLTSRDITAWSVALIGLSRESIYDRSIATRSNLRRLISAAIKKEGEVRTEEEKRAVTIATLTAIGHGKIQEYYSYIHERLDHKDPPIRLSAVEAAGETRAAFFFDGLLTLGMGSQGDLKAACAVSLAKYDEKFIHLYREWEGDHPLTTATKSFLISIVRNIPRQASVDLLFRFLKDPHTTVRWEAIRALNFLKNSHAYLHYDSVSIVATLKAMIDMHLNMLTILYTQNQLDARDGDPEGAARKELIRLLEDRLDRRLEMIFRLLGLKYPPDTMISAYNGLRSDEQEYRLSAAEMLDNLLERDLRQALLPLIETTVLEQISIDVLSQYRMSIPDEAESYQILLRQSDERVIVQVLELLLFKPAQMVKPEIIEELTHHRSRQIRDLAARLNLRIEGH